MERLKPVWRVAVGLAALLGVIAILPFGSFKSPFFNYRFLLPLAPLTTAVFWVLAYVLYRIGEWVTGREIRKPQ